MAKEKTFSSTAPYAPGVTGFAISPVERLQLADAVAAGSSAVYHELAQALTACVAQNIFDMREVRQGTRTFTVFYLNRMLCAHFDLVYHYGGWQRVKLATLIRWTSGRSSTSDFRKLL
jgi:ABC-type sugar transport system ATPase subunit